MAKTSQDRRSKGAGKGSRDGAAAPSDLRGLKVPELRERARGLGVEGASGMKKDELVAAIGGAARSGGAPASASAGADGDARLRTIDEKLGEVLGLARAARAATTRVAELAEDDARRSLLADMGRDAEETARRCEAALGSFGARRGAIEHKADETRDEATEMMRTYLGGDAEELDGFEFLIMAEAGEVSHWAILRTMNERAGIPAVAELTDVAIPVQERHFELVLTTAVAIAADEDPLSEA